MYMDVYIHICQEGKHVVYIQLAYVSEMRKDKLEAERELQRPERGAVGVCYSLLSPSPQPPLQKEPPKESFLFLFQNSRHQEEAAAPSCCQALLPPPEGVSQGG